MVEVKSSNFLETNTVFENETFHSYFIERDKVIESEISFRNCIFKCH